MDRGRKGGARSNRHRRSIEDMRDAVTSTPAEIPLSLRYNETTAESSYSSDTSDYSYDPDESEGSFYGFSHGEVEQSGEEQAKDKHTAQSGDNSQEEISDSRDNSDYEWDELQTAHVSGEEEAWFKRGKNC